MSDSIKKWHELQEDKARTRRLYPGDIVITETPGVVDLPVSDVKKKAYTLLTKYDEEVILMAAKIIDIGQ